MQDNDLFSRHMTGRPSDEGARSARNEMGKISLSRTSRLEELYIFLLEVASDASVVNDYVLFKNTGVER